MARARETCEQGPSGLANCTTGLACLFRLGVQNGTYTEVAGVRRRNLLEGETAPVSQVAEIAGEFGLRAEEAQLNWKKLKSTPFSHPLLLVLKDGNVITLLGLRREGNEAAAISDPRHKDGEPVFIAREELEGAWNGTALIITPLP